ncbi:SseB family protein [Streptomyces sp. NPDC001537]
MKTCVLHETYEGAGVKADALRLRLADLAASGRGGLRAVVGEFRRSEVLVPVVEGSLVSAEAGGIRWLFVFTDDAALARFAAARGEAVPDRVAVYGARLLDQVIPGVGGPVGIAVDAGSAAGMVLPPVTGIVPDAVAVDAAGAEI